MRLRTVRLETAAGVEGAEQGTNGVVVDISSGYNLIDTAVKIEGTRSFHLAHPGNDLTPPRDQTLQLAAVFRGGSLPELKFASRLGWATPDQVAHAQVSVDGGSTWSDVYTRPGTNSRGETTMTRRTIALTGLAGKEFRVRFVYSFSAGQYYDQTDPGFGFYIDEIGFSDVSTVVPLSDSALAGNGAFTFRPSATGTYGLSVRPVVGQREFYDGSLFLVTAVTAPAPAVVNLAMPVIGPNGKVRLDFALVSGAAGTFVLERTAALGGGWSAAVGAVLSTNAPGSYTFRVDPAGDAGYLRVRVD